MKICKNCKHENPDSEDVCEGCGFPLEDDTAGNDTPDKGGITCPQCGKVFDNDDIRFCDACGKNMKGSDVSQADDGDDTSDPGVAASPLPVPDDNGVPASVPDIPSAPSASPFAPPSAASWKLQVVEGMHVGKEYSLYKDEMLVGRMDEEDDIFPDIDLEGQDDGYVSRRHAIFRIKADGVTVEDMGGTNATAVDNKPIPSNTEVSVTAGQVIKTGKVGLMLRND